MQKITLFLLQNQFLILVSIYYTSKILFRTLTWGCRFTMQYLPYTYYLLLNIFRSSIINSSIKITRNCKLLTIKKIIMPHVRVVPWLTVAMSNFIISIIVTLWNIFQYYYYAYTIEKKHSSRIKCLSWRIRFLVMSTLTGKLTHLSEQTSYFKLYQF